MQFSVGVEYAFHSLFYMIDLPARSTIGIKALAQLHGVSESYLSKIFTKLRKGGLVRSVPGVNGGYELMKAPQDISFWDVVEAVEGSTPMFQCAEIRQQNILNNNEEQNTGCPCLIKVVMLEAEEQMRSYLRQKSLFWLYSQVMPTFSSDKKEQLRKWLKATGNLPENDLEC